MRQHVSLDGTWKFCPAFEELEANQRFMDPDFDPESPQSPRERGDDIGWIEPDFDDNGWMDTSVPSSWNKSFPDLWSYEGYGWYRRKFRVPAAWEGKRVEFTSEGSNYRTVLYVNGQEAGVHEGGYTPFSIRIHHLLRYGEVNTLAVSVDNVPKAERCPGGKYDWWNHGGLYRSVGCTITDMVYIDDVTVITDPGGELSRVHVRANIAAEREEDTSLELTAVLSDVAGTEVAAGLCPLSFAGGRAECEIPLEVKDALLWSPEDPNLYGLALEIREISSGKCRDTWQTRVGIRSIKVEGTTLLLNGRPLLVKGVNRYEDYPDSGRTPNEGALRKDLALIKGIGANAIRCHFPNSPRTYELCDEMGILFLSEIPLYQWGRPPALTDSPEALKAAKSQLHEMIRWQRNHPSVFMWSVSNENMTKPRKKAEEEHQQLIKMTVEGNLELVDLIHQLDPTRPVVEVSNCWPGDPVFRKTDLCAVNVYIGAKTPHVDTLYTLAEAMHERMEALRAEYPDKPILAGELGSWAIRGLKTDYFPGETYQAELIRTYWEGFQKEPNFVGGFIWAFADSDVHRRFNWVYELRVSYGLFDLNRLPKEAVEMVRRLWNPENLR